MATVREQTSGSQSLQQLQLVVQQQEGIFGPLIALNGSGAVNVMTFQVAPSPDNAHRAILDAYAGHPPAKSGFSLICIGNCIVGGAPQSVAVYRMTP